MDPVMKVLNRRLREKGVSTNLIPAFFRDFSHSLSAASTMDPKQVGVGMERLGWDELDLDNRTFELMVFALETPQPA